MILRVIRIAHSFEEADRIDRDDIEAMSMADRIRAAIELITETYGQASAPRLARILRRAPNREGALRRRGSALSD
jgi:hypothetical protein